MSREFEPRITGFLCNWCCYAGADLAGVSRYQYPPNIRIIRLMCSGRVDPEFVVRAFMRGSDGVFIGGCWPGECHYVTEGNYDALGMMHLMRRVMKQIGLEPERLRLEWVSASEGIRFAEVMNDFTGRLKQLGPAGSAEGLDEVTMQKRLGIVRRLVPYLKLVQAGKIQTPWRDPERCDDYFRSEEFEMLYEQLVGTKLDELLVAAGHAEQPAVETEKVDAVVDSYGAHERWLIEILIDLQKQLGWLPPQALERVSERLGVPMSRVRQVSTFYRAFCVEPSEKGGGEIRRFPGGR